MTLPTENGLNPSHVRIVSDGIAVSSRVEVDGEYLPNAPQPSKGNWMRTPATPRRRSQSSA